MKKAMFCRGLMSIAVAAAALGEASFAMAKSFPTQPVTIIVPAAAGGSLDIIVRSVAPKMAEKLGTSVVVENKPGASQTIGVQALLRSAADGHTLLAVSNTTVTAPSLLKDVKYDPAKDFSPISVIAKVPAVLVVSPDSEFRSVAELIQAAQRPNATLSGGTAGNGSFAHITTEEFFERAGIKTLLVPYKGGAPALVDVMGGRVDFFFSVVPESVELISSGRLKALAVTSGTRSPLFPSTPTLQEAGLKNFVAEVFNGLVAPAGTPVEVIEKLHAALKYAVNDSSLQSRYTAQGVNLQTSATPAEFAAFLGTETERYAKLISEMKISD